MTGSPLFGKIAGDPLFRKIAGDPLFRKIAGDPLFGKMRVGVIHLLSRIALCEFW